jgi:hypothetical protein
MVKGYTPMSMKVAVPYGVDNLVDSFEYINEMGVNAWLGYNLVDGISTLEEYSYYAFILYLKHPNGYIEQLIISTSHIFIPGEAKVRLSLGSNLPGETVYVSFDAIDINESGFTPRRLLQVINDQDVILVDEFSIDEYGQISGTLLHSCANPDGDLTTDPILFMSEGVTVNLSGYDPEDNPQYSEPTLYLNSDDSTATLLLKDHLVNNKKIVSNNIFSRLEAYQIVESEINNWHKIAESFGKDTEKADFVYVGTYNDNYIDGESSEDIITLRCTPYIENIPDPSLNTPEVYVSGTTMESGEGITLELKGNYKDYRPGNLYQYIEGESDLVLVSSGSWTSIGYGAFTGNLETKYNNYTDLRVVVYDPSDNEKILPCQVAIGDYVAPTISKCYIKNNQIGDPITVVIGTQFEYYNPEVNIGDLELVRVKDTVDTVIAENDFSRNSSRIFTGTLISIAEDAENSTGRIILMGDETDYTIDTEFILSEYDFDQYYGGE